MSDIINKVPAACDALPGMYEPWPGDPGPHPDDRPPFPIRMHEKFLFFTSVATFQRRLSTGAFRFDPEDGAAPIIRSAWRLQREFESRILERLQRGGAEKSSRAHDAGTKLRITETQREKAITSGEKAKFYIERFREDATRRLNEGQPPLPRVGPREKGARSAPHFPPRNVDEFLANVAAERGDAQETRIHWKTFIGKLAKFEHLDLIPVVQAADGRCFSLQPLRTKYEVRKIALDVIWNALSAGETIEGFRRLIRNALREENKKRPGPLKLQEEIGRTAVENILATIPGIEVCEVTRGRRKARIIYRMTGKINRPPEPMTLVEFDWHLLDLETKYPDTAKFLSELAGKPIKRIWLIAGVCVATGWCVGFAWTVDAVWRGDILEALDHIIKRKPTYSTEGAECAYLAYGIPKILAYDLGKANIAKDVVRAYLELGGAIARGPKGEPVARPHIERFFGTVEQEFIAKLPGWVGYNVQTRPDEETPPPELLATDELKRRFVTYLLDYHANHSPSSRWMSPRAAWLDFESKHPLWVPDSAPTDEILDIALRVSVRRKATDEGVRFLDLFFNGDAIRKIRSDHHAHSKGDPTIELRLKHSNIADVKVFDPHPTTGGWKSVECQDRGYAEGKSLRLHRIILSVCKASKKADEKITGPLLDATYAKITKRVLARGRKPGGRRASAHAAATLAALMGPGGTDRIAAGRTRKLTAAEFEKALRAPPKQLALVAPASGEEIFDQSAALARLAGHITGSASNQPTHETAPPLAPADSNAPAEAEEDPDDEI